jgi:hypothetical protein
MHWRNHGADCYAFGSPRSLHSYWCATSSGCSTPWASWVW